MNNYTEILNDALILLNEMTLPENKLFVMSSDFSGDDFTRVQCSIINKLPLIMDFSKEGIDLHIDGASEVFSWGQDFIRKERKTVIDKFVMILTARVCIISYGKCYKKITFESCEKDIVIERLRVFDGFLFNPFGKVKKCYPALIEKIVKDS
jgi:hypothetical protein